MLTQLFPLVFSSQSFRTARETQAKAGTDTDFSESLDTAESPNKKMIYR